MSEFITRVGTATLMGAALLPWIALSVAHAEPATIKISDLNMSRPAHVAVFNARVERAADKFCAGKVDTRSLQALNACKRAVREDAADQMSQVLAKNAGMTLASR